VNQQVTKFIAKQLLRAALARSEQARPKVLSRPARVQPPKPRSLVRKYGEFVRFSHTLFALPFALASMVVAARQTHGWPGSRLLVLILAAMVTARTCAMSFNRIMDRHYDKTNPRTAMRHLPTGQISLVEAWGLCLGSAAAFVGTTWFINSICFILAPVALFVICFYSLTKRFTDFTHVYLGIALALAPLGAWFAVKGSVALWPLDESVILPLLMGAAVVLWLVGFDIIYSIQDYQFDRTHGLHSLVVRWGVKNALGVAFFAHLGMWILLAVFGLLCGFRLSYLVGMFIILASLVLEHWLARKRSLKWINVAFFRLNAFISVVFLVVTVVEVIFPRFTLVR